MSTGGITPATTNPSYQPNTVVSKDGAFYITDKDGNTTEVDLGTLMMMLNLDRVSNLDRQLEAQLTEIQERNALLTELTEFMDSCRAAKANGQGPGFPGQMTALEYKEKLSEFGISCDALPASVKPSKDEDKKTWEAQWDAVISSIQSKISNLNNDSQMANIKLQNLMDKRNNAFEMASQVMKSNTGTVESVIRNLG